MKLATANPFQGLEEFVLENEPLVKRTWYKIGGPARWFIQPRSVEELQEAARRCVENEVPIYVLGLGANLLVKDEGVNGAVFHLDADHWRRVKFDKNKLEVGAASLNRSGRPFFDRTPFAPTRQPAESSIAFAAVVSNAGILTVVSA